MKWLGVIAIFLCSNLIGDEIKIAKLLEPTVRVQMNTDNGSGFVIYSKESEPGKFRTFIMTCYHVIESGIHNTKDGEVRNKCDIVFTKISYNGHRPIRVKKKAYVVAYNSVMDCALLEIYDNTFKWSSTSFVDNYYLTSLFDTVWNVGYPSRENVNFSKGIITGFDEAIHYGEYGIGANYVRTNAPIFYGNSGGPTFVEQEGEYKVIGMVARIFHEDTPHIALSVSIGSIRQFFEINDLEFLENDGVSIPERIKPYVRSGEAK